MAGIDGEHHEMHPEVLTVFERPKGQVHHPESMRYSRMFCIPIGP